MRTGTNERERLKNKREKRKIIGGKKRKKRKCKNEMLKEADGRERKKWEGEKVEGRLQL